MQDIKIGILKTGQIVIGEYSKTDNICNFSNAGIIESIGNTKGIADIVANGPTGNTLIIKTGNDIEVPWENISFIMQCNLGKWENKI